MARTGGNPELKKHCYISAGDEPLDKHLQLMITNTMMIKVKSVNGKWQDFVRSAIQEKLDNMGS